MRYLKIKRSTRILISILSIVGIVAFFHDCKKTPTEPRLPQNGEIRVESSPTGAKVYLDGLDTGRTTNCILPDITPGNHIVKLIYEGYKDAEQNVNVTAGGTSSVNINFVAHSITILEPLMESVMMIGEEVEIRWQTDNNTRLSGNIGIADYPTQSNEKNNTFEDVKLLTLTNVRIELFKGASQERTIVSNTENDGLYEWRVPSNLGMASNYRVKISCGTEPDIFGMSDKFSIEFPHKEYSWGPEWGSWMSIYASKWTTVKVNINDVGIIKKVDFFVFTFSFAHSGMKGSLEHNNTICNFSGSILGYGGGKETNIFNGLQMNGEWIFKIRGDPTELGGDYWGSLDGISMTIYYSNSN